MKEMVGVVEERDRDDTRTASEVHARHKADTALPSIILPLPRVTNKVSTVETKSMTYPETEGRKRGLRLRTYFRRYGPKAQFGQPQCTPERYP